jgi:hypothetical protein
MTTATGQDRQATEEISGILSDSRLAELPVWNPLFHPSHTANDHLHDAAICGFHRAAD